MNIGILGRGNVAKRLFELFGNAGHNVSFGVRTPQSSSEGLLDSVCQTAEMIVVAIPFLACRDVLPTLAQAIGNKIVVDATNPLNDDWSPYLLGEENSGGEEIQNLLPEARVVKAFNTVFADIMLPEKLERGGHKVTAFVAGDISEANQQVAELGRAAGFSPIQVGGLANARYLEAIAHLNIQIAVGQKGGTDAAFLYHQAT